MRIHVESEWVLLYFTVFAVNCSYNEYGSVSQLQLGNTWKSTEFNNRLQQIEISLGTSSGGSERLKLDYNYGSTDNNGNVQAQTITVPTIGTATGFVTTQAYSYDSLNRLASVAETPYGTTTADWRQQFGYDRYGNRAMGTGSTQTYGRNSTETQSLIGPDPTVSTSTNRITNKTGEHYEFDASGNMTKDALGNRSVYDVDNHQTEYYYSANNTENPDAKYFYDGDGKRIKKVVGTEVTIFVYDAGGRLVAEYTLGVTANSNPQTNYITTDTLGSTRLVTNGAGQVVARHDYLPFGDEIYGLGGRTSAQGFSQPDSTRQRFTGYEHDTETGLDFAQARYYGNGLGRFTSVDPSRKSVAVIDPQTWNRYLYCLNRPLHLVDKNGKWPTETHNKILRRAFDTMAKVDPRSLTSIQEGSARVDSDGLNVKILYESNAYQHAMIPGAMVRKLGSVEKARDWARNKAIDFIVDNLGQANMLQSMIKSTPEEGKYLVLQNSLAAFGAATHPIMDNVSPAHRGFQIFDYRSDVIAGAARGALQNGLGGAVVGAVTGIPESLLEHKETEAREPTEEEYNTMVDEIRLRFREAYGQARYEQSVSLEQRRLTDERLARRGYLGMLRR